MDEAPAHPHSAVIKPPSSPPLNRTAMPPAGPSLPPDVLAALDAGQLIEAIKRLRAATGLGLKEAKDLIDAHQRGEAVSVAARAAQPLDGSFHVPDAVR